MSRLPSIDQFIEQYITEGSRRHSINSYTRWTGLTVYVRVGPRFINGVIHPLVIDLANVVADVPGAGAFKRLIQHLKEKFPTFDLHVECVLTERFQEGLKRMGFQAQKACPDCFYMPRSKDDVQP
jgi:hypothetical protein